MSKEQRKFERMLAAGNKDASEGSARVIGHYEYDFKAGTEKFTPSNSEEGEQPMKEEEQYPDSVGSAIGLLDFLRHEIDYLPDDIYERINNVIHQLECEFDSTPSPQEGEQESKIDIIQLHEEWRKTDDLNFFDWLKQQGYTLTKK